jgi:hypothetical protein
MSLAVVGAACGSGTTGMDMEADSLAESQDGLTVMERFYPDGDTTLRSGRRDSERNFSDDVKLELAAEDELGTSKEAYFSFVVPPLKRGSPKVARVILWVMPMDSGASGVLTEVEDFKAEDVTWTSRPKSIAPVDRAQFYATRGKWAMFELTHHVTSPGEYFMKLSTDFPTGATYFSHEAGERLAPRITLYHDQLIP